jgi:hypothetical protein
MEERWLTVDEITENNLMSKVNLVSNVRSRYLTAYDYHSGNPVDFDAMEKQFKEIAEMSSKKIIGTKYENIETINKYTGEKGFNYTGRKAEIELLIYQPDEWTDKNGIHRTPFIPWGVLHLRLSQKIQTRVSLSQYDTILKGWGNKQIEIVVFESVFLERDILKFSDSNKTNLQEKNNNRPIAPKTERTDLLIIGGLLGLLKEHFESEAQIITALNEWNPRTPGYSKRNLEDRFKKAKSALDQQE